jgi:hypothetical protein
MAPATPNLSGSPNEADQANGQRQRARRPGIDAVGPAASAVKGDPDAELKRQWHKVVTAYGPAADMRTRVDDETDRITREIWAPAYDAAMALPARTLGGIAVKVQILAHEMAYGPSDGLNELLATTLQAMERLAPGSVIDRPESTRGNP